MQKLYRTPAVAGLTLAASLLLAGPSSAADLDCADFASQAAAQAHYMANPTDPDGLDADDDGVACENYSSYSDTARNEVPLGTVVDNGGDDDDDQVPTPPQGGVATGGGSTTGVEHAGLLVAGGLALTLGTGGLAMSAARRSRR
ncbi:MULTISPECIES: excalibur calcium-binding domain-containing protein [unclassified Ornithinimicrobium]|uniref:excalibur calcium-binding domain-containing protein n=1 Tax=unclassified Ornithinimicrobium TaxID=2615080 RepID=UPI0038551514